MGREIRWYEFSRGLNEAGYKLEDIDRFIPEGLSHHQEMALYLGVVRDAHEVRTHVESQRQRRYGN